MPPSPPSPRQRHQFEVERELAARLLSAAPAERRPLYGIVYDRLFREFPELTPSVEVRESGLQLQFQLIAPFLKAGASILEIGAGDAAISRRVAELLGVRAFAIEASAEAMAAAAPHPCLTTLVCDGPPYPMPDRSVQFAYSCHFIEHLHPDDAREHFGEVLRLLAPEAPYVCVTPNRLLGPHDVSRDFGTVASGLHLREYSYGDLARELRSAGFVGLRALLGVDRPPLAVPVTLAIAFEALLARLPRTWRGPLLAWRGFGGRPAPLRILEQVKLLARRPATSPPNR